MKNTSEKVLMSNMKDEIKAAVTGKYKDAILEKVTKRNEKV